MRSKSETHVCFVFKLFSNIIMKTIKQNVCRTCMSEEKQGVSLFAMNGNNEQFCQLLTACAPVHVYEGDGLPDHICSKCLNDLKTSFDFRKRTELSDKKFRQLLLDRSQTIERTGDSEKQDSNATEYDDHNRSDKHYEETIETDKNKTKKTKQSYVCDICKKQYRARCYLERHKLSHSHEPFSCSECSKTFVRRSSLTTHQRMHSGLKPYTCEYCSKQFGHSSHYRCHLRIHTDKEKYREYLDKRKRQEKPSVRKKRFQCEVCGKIFSAPCYLNRHLRSHTGLCPFKCSFCEKAFNNASTLTIHERIHSGDRPYACAECPKRFYDKTNYGRHLKLHTGDKRYGCSVCSQRFTRPSILKNHMKTHTGQTKPQSNECGACRFRCSDLDGLRSHVSTHIDIDASTVCRVCCKIFASAGTLKAHARVHSTKRPYSCEVCNKTFLQSRSLAVHLRGHNGDVDYQCKECDKTFVAANYLKKHVVSVHCSEKKPLTCCVCGRGFVERENLTKHMEIHSESYKPILLPDMPV